jgi:hypothetical protein
LPDADDASANETRAQRIAANVARIRLWVKIVIARLAQSPGTSGRICKAEKSKTRDRSDTQFVAEGEKLGSNILRADSVFGWLVSAGPHWPLVISLISSSHAIERAATYRTAWISARSRTGTGSVASSIRIGTTAAQSSLAAYGPILNFELTSVAGAIRYRFDAASHIELLRGQGNFADANRSSSGH